MKMPVLVSVWTAFKSKGTQVPLHSHNYYELVYYPKGTGTTKAGSTEYLFSAGTFMLLPPQLPHNESHHADSEVICLGFLSEEAFSAAQFSDPERTVCGLLREILREASRQDYGYKEFLSAKLLELCIRIRRMQRESAGGTKDFEYIIRYLEENYHERLILSDCARQLNLSYDYFQHRFKALTGLSPQAFLLQQRILAAKQLLEQGALSCTEIAGRCGFSTAAQFSMQFKRAEGISPLQYRRTL